MTKRNPIIQRYRNKLIHITNLCSFLLKSLPSWSRQKKPNLKHNTLLLNNTLQNNQQPLLTNSTMSLHHELFVISLTNSILSSTPSDSPSVTLTHILDCYDHILKILQSLNFDSQRNTQSSKAIQRTLENLNIVFSNPTNDSQVNLTFFFLSYTSNSSIQKNSLTFL